ncbi:MAG TPA: ABC transporter permease [Bryobacteraceae bacterium]|jgi:predicted permease|nr:ABC transporter permease [Bryobacteraceae bacterium]
MRTIRRFFRRLISWATTQRDEERLRAEIEEHLALQTDENVRAGLSPIEARRQAVLKFGAVEAVRESYRAQKGLPLMETLVQDIRHGLRRLRNAPAFTITTVLTLALGIGATTSIFTLVYAVMMKSLAVANPHELYKLGKEARCCYEGGYSQEKEFSLVSYELYKYLRDNTKGFVELAAFPAVEPLFGIRRAGRAEAAQSYPGEFVSGNYFAMFGIRAYAGRVLTASDDQPNAAPVAVMSYRLWQREYGSDPSVIGAVFNLDDKPFTVVGVTPPGFFGDTLRDTPPDFFVPLNTEPLVEADADLNKVDTHWLDLIGRIQPGATPGFIEAEMRVELKQWLRSHWGEMSANDRANFPSQTLFLSPGGAGITSMREEYEHWLQILMMVSGFVLLIVCANVANLLLVRGMERRRQISLSMALGAKPSRLVKQALTESILLSLLGGMAGLAIAFAGTRVILHFAFPPAGGMAGIPISASPSMAVLLFAFGVSVITGLAFGIAPAWMATRVDPIEALRGASRSTVRTRSLPRKALVVLQAALSLALLTTSGLLATALHRLEHQDFGFDRDRRIVANMNPRLAGYRYDQVTPLYGRIHDSLVEIPGVSGVALCTYSPLSGNAWGAGVWVDGHPAPGPNADNLAFWNRVTAGYFDVIGNPIVRGRGISEQDTAASRHVAVINEAFARKFFKNEDPIGKHFGRGNIDSQRDYEIVGIAKDARYLTFGLDAPVRPFFSLPEMQHDLSPGAGLMESAPSSHFLSDVVIVTRPSVYLSETRLRQALASVDPNLPVISIRSLKEQVDGQFRQQRLIARLTSFFGVLSLVLASIGLYGATAYNAGRRTSEIGVRIALGADRGDVVGLVLRGAFGLIVFGLLIGLPLTFAAGRFLGNQLYGMNPYNPVVTLIAVVTLGLSALLASLIPALRASSISPVEALRVE